MHGLKISVSQRLDLFLDTVDAKNGVKLRGCAEVVHDL